MKAQLGLDYIIAIVFFISIAVYLIYHVMKLMPTYLMEAHAEVLRAETYKLSELLVNDVGFPPNWNELYLTNLEEIKRAGLSNHSSNLTNFLSKEKVDVFNRSCNENYEYVKRWLGTEYNFSVTLTTTAGTLIECAPPTKALWKAVVKRFIALSNDYGSLVVKVME